MATHRRLDTGAPNQATPHCSADQHRAHIQNHREQTRRMKHFMHWWIYLIVTSLLVTNTNRESIQSEIHIYMLYITERSGYCMLRRHRCFTYADTLRYGIINKCLDTTKLYDMENRNMIRKLYKDIRSYKEVEHIHRFKERSDSTWELTKIREGRTRGATKQRDSRGTQRGR